jgi:HemY protein
VKKILILSLLAMSAGLLLALQLAKDPGYVLIAYGGWTFETSLFALLILIVLVLIVLRLIYLLLAWLNPVRFFRSSRKQL